MKEAFDRMTKLRSYVDDNFSGATGTWLCDGHRRQGRRAVHG
jgi:hypothetical protein